MFHVEHRNNHGQSHRGHSPRDPNSLINGAYPVYRTFGVTTWEGDKVNNIEAQKLVAYLLKTHEGIVLIGLRRGLS